MIQITTILVVW